MAKNGAPLKDVLKKLLKKLGPEAKKKKIMTAWKDTTTGDAKEHAKPVAFKKGRLVVNVSDSSRLYGLTLRKRELIDGLNRKLGENKVKEIRFRIGNMRKGET